MKTTEALAREAGMASLALPFNLRPGYLAQVVVPRDMTKAEADRLCAFVMSLAQPAAAIRSTPPTGE